MKSPKISIVVAIGAHNRVIGKDNALPWHIKADMEHFKNLTLGHPVIMGRNTWESIPERFRPLPHRDNLVITRNEEYVAPGATVVPSLEKAIEIARENDSDEIFVIGGATIYEQALGIADTLHITLIEGDFQGDTFFPEYKDMFQKVSRKKGMEDGVSFSFLTYTKKAE